MHSMNILYFGPNKKHIISSKLKNINIQHCDDLNLIDNPEQISIIIDASLKFSFDSILLSKFINLKFFVICATGSSHVDVKYLHEKHIDLFTLLNCPDIKNITSAAEFAWSQILCSIRKNHLANQHVKELNFNREPELNGFMLNKKTLGVIGCGRIGSWICKYANAFNMSVIGFDPFITQNSDFVYNGGTLVTKQELLCNSDIISVCMPYNEINHHFIDYNDFSQMKENVVFTSISIGQIINENALELYLQNKKILSAAIDYLHFKNGVLYEYFINHNNLMITPRIGGFCNDSLDFVIEVCCNKIKEKYPCLMN